MYWLLKDNIIVSIGSSFQKMEGCETIKINSNVKIGDFLEEYDAIDKSLQDFEKESEEYNKKLLQEYEKQVEKNEELDEEKRKEIQKPKYKEPWFEFQEYLDSLELSNVIVVETEESKQLEYSNKVKEINTAFDEKINEFLSKYPKREQETFWEKKREAEKVVAWGSSIYIEWKAKALKITPEQFAHIIITKNNEWVELYTQLENEKDAEILALNS